MYFSNKIKMLKKISIYPVLITGILGLSACSLNDADRDDYANSKADEIYQEAVTHLDKGRFNPAVKSYEALETHFPFGDTTTKGQLEIIYAYYKDQEYLQSITAAERFLRLHPLHQDADYVFYMKGVNYFEQGRNFLTRFMPINPAYRDISNYHAAFHNFKTVVNNYPTSKYAKDARAHMIYIRNIIAEHELNIANYYYEREAYLAAANRATYVLEHIPNTPAEKPALDVLEKSYSRLKLNKASAS